MSQYLHEADHPGVLDFNAGHTSVAGGDGQGELLEKRVIHVNIQSLRFKGGEAVGDGR
jgi:hypothetical protein